MIICMSEIICVTDRKLCRDDFLSRLEEIAKSRVKGVILREKDLTEEEYTALAKEAQKACGEKLIIHTHENVAKLLGIKKIHMPMTALENMRIDRAYFDEVGASCHSVKEAEKAQRMGCTYITAGHIFATDCKRGLPPRGTGFLKEVCGAVHIPVYAIGGISIDNIQLVKEAGAVGACVMSGGMVCENILKYFEDLGR